MGLRFNIVQGLVNLIDSIGNVVGTKQISGELDGEGNPLHRLAIMCPSQGPVSPGDVALKTTLIGGQFNQILPIATDTQQLSFQLDGRGRLITAGITLDPLPAAEIINDTFIAANKTTYTMYTATQKLAIKQFYATGSGIGKQSLWFYHPDVTQFSEYGDFESADDVAQWTKINNGETSTLSYSTEQAYTGTGSAKVVFLKSDNNNNTILRRTFSPTMDLTVWKTITAAFYNNLPEGGKVTRTISIIITDSAGSTRSYSVSGLTNAAPFNASGWISIIGDLRNPTTSVGVGFDLSDVVSLDLKFVDSGNKAGTIYWDSVIQKEEMNIILPIFHQANMGLNINIDPVKVLEIDDQVIITQTSLDTTRKEFFSLAGAIAI